MPNLLVKPGLGRGRIISVTPETAGWTFVGFDLHKLAPGESVGALTRNREVCLVLVSGKAKVAAGAREFGEVGERMTPFKGKPHAVYVLTSRLRPM